MAMATRVAGNKEGYGKGGWGNGNSNKKGNGNRRQQHRQWLQKRRWQASNGSNNGDGDEDCAKDMAACATTGERGVMVVMGHGLCVSFCVCGETTKNKVGPKKG
jgi:hypothetical protein